MNMASFSWSKHRVGIVEAFVAGNLAFLAVDIYLAHAVNDFHHPAEWIPFYVSLLAPILLVIDGFRRRWGRGGLGIFTGWLCIAVGLAGLFYHLDSQFFQTHTMASLVYTAPFAAPRRRAAVRG